MTPISKTQQTNLVNAAIEAQNNAYCPYSKYKVGSAIITASGKIFKGCNYENAAYGSTICAERNAIGTMITEGEKTIIAVAVVTIHGTGTPCGSCRQVLNEFKSKKKDLHVFTAKPDGKILKTTTLAKILPDAFGPHDLS